MLHTRYSEAEGKKVAEQLLSLVVPHHNKATVVGLSGDLGAGKTTLVQAIGKQLGVHEAMQSPTFVIAKFYSAESDVFSQLIHIDAYRIEHMDELAALGFSELLARPNTLIMIEWPERITDALPAHTHFFSIAHDGDQRTIAHA